MAGCVEFFGRLENRLRAQGGPGVVADEQGLEFADDFLGSGFRVDLNCAIAMNGFL